jgi:GGDEF domain-containing protein
MDPKELVIWSAMLGGLLTLVTVAVADVVMHKSAASWRGLFFVVMTGTSAVLMSGLPELLFPGHPAMLFQIVKALLGPISAALALTYLGMWLGPAADDRLVHIAVGWGAPFLILSTVIVIAAQMLYPSDDSINLVMVTAPINCIGVILATLASVRAALLGDQLARWMVVASLFLAVMVAGLYTHELLLVRMDPWAIAITAFCTVSYFLIVTALSLRRHRQQRNLKRLAGLSQGSDPNTGLPTGSVLLAKVSDAFWRSARIRRECTVVCLHLRNLYQLGETAGHSVDQQILSAVTARIRRAVGFRNVVGLYHPRCFVIVISSDKQRNAVERVLSRIRLVLDQPMQVVGLDEQFHQFTPHFGLGIVTVDAAKADPAIAIDEAERLALQNQMTDPHSVSDSETAPATLFPMHDSTH